MPLVCSVPDYLDLHLYKGPSKYLEEFGVLEYTQKFVKKNTFLKKMHFSPKNWKPTEENMASQKQRP